jgi:hypothetical protein
MIEYNENLVEIPTVKGSVWIDPRVITAVRWYENFRGEQTGQEASVEVKFATDADGRAVGWIFTVHTVAEAQDAVYRLTPTKGVTAHIH